MVLWPYWLCVSVHRRSWQAIGFVFPTPSLSSGRAHILPCRPAHVCSIIFGSIFPLWVGLSGWFAPLVLLGRWSSAFWSGPSFLMVLRLIIVNSPHNTYPVGILFVGLCVTLIHLQHSRGRSRHRPLIFFLFYVYVIFRILLLNCYLTLSVIIFEYKISTMRALGDSRYYTADS